MADIFDAYPMSAAWDEMFVRPGVPRSPYRSVFATLQPLAGADLRYRADQFMAICWRVFVPLGLLIVAAAAVWKVYA